jgi:hypothetical protein
MELDLYYCLIKILSPVPLLDQSNPDPSVSLRPILILLSYLCLGLESGFFPSHFPTKIWYGFAL